MPSVVDPDGRIYVRAKDGCIVAGGFEENAQPAFEDMEHMPGGWVNVGRKTCLVDCVMDGWIGNCGSR